MKGLNQEGRIEKLMREISVFAAVSGHSFKQAFLVLAMAGPYLWWIFVRYFK